MVGDLAVIFDNDRGFVAIGLWDQLTDRIRVPSRKAGDDRHHLLAATHCAAVERRASLGDKTNGYRLISENDDFPASFSTATGCVGVEMQPSVDPTCTN